MPITIPSPVAGRLVALDDVPDPVFARRLMGDGFAVDPASGEFAAPVAGTILLVAPTGHAFGLRTDDGLELLVHVGLDTVALKGEGFTVHHQAGDRVAAGEVVISADLDLLRDRVPSLLSPVVVTSAGATVVARRLDDLTAVIDVELA